MLDCNVALGGHCVLNAHSGAIAWFSIFVTHGSVIGFGRLSFNQIWLNRDIARSLYIQGPSQFQAFPFRIKYQLPGKDGSTLAAQSGIVELVPFSLMFRSFC